MPSCLKCALFLCCLVALNGCASVSPDGSFHDLQGTVSQHSGQIVQWRGHDIDDEQADRAVQDLLSRELTVDSAVQITLLNNRSLQASLEDIGIAQADLVQAGLLSNPVFFASLRFPDKSPNGTDSEFSVEQDFLDLLLIPLRQKLAGSELERTKLSVADQVLRLAADVKIACYTIEARQQLIDGLGASVATDQAALDLARRQAEAGTINDLTVSNWQIAAAQSKVDLAQAKLQLDADRERLNRLLGLNGAQTRWTLPANLPAFPEKEISASGLESTALSQRMDLAAQRAELAAMADALSTTRGFRYFASVDVGLDTERTPDSQRVTGPTISLQIPIFDQGQARVAAAAARFRQAQDRYEALAVDVCSQVREASDRLAATRALADAQLDLLHQRTHVSDLTLQQYNGMLKGAYDLLQGKQGELDAQRSDIEACRDYWIARTELERAVGGKLPPATPAKGD